MYQQLKDAIAAIIKENNNNEIDGLDLQGVFNNLLIPELGQANYQGTAIPTTDPGTPERPVYYLASVDGTYDFFPTSATKDVVISQEAAILFFDGLYWRKDSFLDFTGQLEGATVAYVDQQDDELRGLIGSGGSTAINKINKKSAGYQGGFKYQPYGDWNFGETNYEKTANPPLILAAADATYDRIDLIVYNSAGNIIIKQGTPSANPTEPDTDPNTELVAFLIIVPAGAAAPEGVSLVKIFDENAGNPDEWSAEVDSGLWNLGDTTDPYNGAVAIKGTDLAQYDRLHLTPPAAIPVAYFTEVTLVVKNVTSQEISPFYLEVFGDTGNQRGAKTRVLSLGNLAEFGYDPQNTNDWQFIAVPVGALGIIDVQRLSINVNYNFTTPALVTAFFDLIQYNDGSAPSGENFATVGYVDRRDNETLAKAKEYADNLVSPGGTTVTISTSRVLTADDNKGKLLITAPITLTWPSPGIAGFEINFDVDAAGQLTIDDEAATPGNDLDAVNGTILEAGKMGHAYARPDNGKLRLKGDFIV